MNGARRRNPLATPGELLAGRYRIDALLAQGGMADVFRAGDLALRRDVAIKIIAPRVTEMPNAAARFMREARALAALDSPHLVAIHDVGETGERLFLVQDLLEGRSLDAHLARSGAGDAELAASAADVLVGLEEMHGAGLVHRDVKPSNIWLEPSGRAVLLDLGIVLDERADRITDEGVVLGTPEFMAPEQARGERPTSASDLYSLALVLLVSLTERSDALETDSSVQRRSEGDRWLDDGLDRVTPAAQRFFRRALAHTPAQRFDTAREMRGAMADVDTWRAPPARPGARTRISRLATPTIPERPRRRDE